MGRQRQKVNKKERIALEDDARQQSLKMTYTVATLENDTLLYLYSNSEEDDHTKRKRALALLRG